MHNHAERLIASPHERQNLPEGVYKWVTGEHYKSHGELSRDEGGQKARPGRYRQLIVSVAILFREKSREPV